jgi:SET domain-containing protein
MREAFGVRKCQLGKGLFATDFIPREAPILQMKGQRINLSQALAKGEKQSDPLQIGQDQYVDLEDPGRCANHSCDPNAGVRGDLMLVALKNIAPEEEICYDYSTTMGDGLWEIPRRCDSSSCRGLIRDFRFLPPKKQTFYLHSGVVQNCLYVESFV